jgi:Bacterial Ig domain/RTX calcium-binding nonapeptide repeat (4 copies)
MTDVINGSGIDDTLPESGAVIETDVLINGGGGDDTISGGTGDDTINAGGGDDLISGGEGDDTIRGGGGVDTVIYDFDLVGGEFEFGQDKSYLTFETDVSGTDYLKQIEVLQFNNGTYIVGAENQAAFVSDVLASTDEDTAFNFNVGGAVFDIEGDAITYSSVTSSMGATVSINASGVISYDPTTSATLQALESGDSAQDEVTFWVSDAGTGTLVQGMALVDVSGLSEGPSLDFELGLSGWSTAGSGASTLGYTPINGILGQDFDSDGIADYTGAVTSAPLLDMDGGAAWIRGDLGDGSSLASIESLFGLSAGYIGTTFTNTDLTAADGSAIQTSVYLEVGQTLSFEWAMVANDGYAGFGGTDTAFYIDLNGDMQVLGDQFDVDSTTTEARVMDNAPIWVDYVSFTGFGSIGTNGWQTVELTATSAGDYDIGFGLLNDDFANGSTDLYIDNITIA